MAGITKQNFRAIASDITEGFIIINPLFLKSFDEKSLKSLCNAIERRQMEIRAEPFPYNDIDLIRKRNLKLQRLYAALTVIRNFAREKRINIR